MNRRSLPAWLGVMAVTAALSACTSDEPQAQVPELDARGTVLTTVKPERRDLSNKVSLTGKVTINPVYGIVAPADGELRFVDRTPPKVPLSQPTWVATIWGDGAPFRVEIPSGSVMAGRLMPDRTRVTAGMPIVSASRSGYGIVADIDSALAYRISGAAKSVRGQIKNGPGPFGCSPLGTIAALPAGTIPEPPRTTAPATPTGGVVAAEVPSPGAETPDGAGSSGSEPTGLQLVCTAPDEVKLINGAAVTLELVTGRAKNALVLPVEAIAGSQGEGKVDVVGPDHTRRTVDVVLGLTDGKVVQIKKGLRGDEDIAVPGPDLPAAPDGGDGGDGGGPK